MKSTRIYTHRRERREKVKPHSRERTLGRERRVTPRHQGHCGNGVLGHWQVDVQVPALGPLRGPRLRLRGSLHAFRRLHVDSACNVFPFCPAWPVSVPGMTLPPSVEVGD